MAGDYLAKLPPEQRELLSVANADGLGALVELLSAGQPVAFLGAGVSVPLYPLWGALIDELITRAAPGLGPDKTATCQVLAASSPDAVVELIRRGLGGPRYREVLRELFRVRRYPESGRSWTPTQELIARCRFAGVVTTNYDPGIVDARMRVRSRASGTGFATWADEGLMDRWRTGEVFGDDELPVLYAHGQHNRPEDIVLATADYRRAYAGKLAKVLRQSVDTGHLVWIGFSFADQRIAAIIREVAEGSGPAIDPGVAGRHIAIMPWDPAGANDPAVLRTIAEIQYSSRLILYPAPGGDHSALQVLLEELADPAYPPVGMALPVPTEPSPPSQAVCWVHGGTPVEHFTGRAEELARLDRWSTDPEVRLIGVTAWGGAGKTALVTEWLTRRTPLPLFAWSFYENRSAEQWAAALLDWADQALGLRVDPAPLATRVLALARVMPLLLVLDGLEILQEGPAGGEFGRMLDGTLRDVLTGWCQQPHAGLAVLTSRFPFADLDQFDGGPARMLDVPPFTPGEGASLLAAAGGGWLAENRRRDLVAAVDGHALAVAALARLLADHVPVTDLDALHGELIAAGRTNARVGKVLAYYADQLTEVDRWLVAIVSLFQTPVGAATVLALGASDELGQPLAACDATWVEQAVRQRLGGLLTWHPDRTLTAHPLVRDAFRPIALTGNAAQLTSEAVLADLPDGDVTSRPDAARVVEMIELLLDADEWSAADDLYQARTDDGQVWKHLPAARLGHRAASAFVATTLRQHACERALGAQRMAYYLNEAGLFGGAAGDLSGAIAFFRARLGFAYVGDHDLSFAVSLENLAECYILLGDASQALQACTDAIGFAIRADDSAEQSDAQGYLAAALDLAGDIAGADREFRAADLKRLSGDGDHFESLIGVWWGDFLLRTGRIDPARGRAEHGQETARTFGWNDDIARTGRLLARCDLATDDLGRVEHHLAPAVAIFRDGDYLTDWADALPDLAEYQRRIGDALEAEQTCSLAVATAGPRGLVPTHARALATRARARADLRTRTGDPNHLAKARDDADHALRLTTRTRRLPWGELDALDAHAYLDRIAGRDYGWQQKAEALRAVLIPAGLDPDPLASNEQANEAGGG
jgi:tetratricopeptide (TPR) repeat protein